MLYYTIIDIYPIVLRPPFNHRLTEFDKRTTLCPGPPPARFTASAFRPSSCVCLYVFLLDSSTSFFFQITSQNYLLLPSPMPNLLRPSLNTKEQDIFFSKLSIEDISEMCDQAGKKITKTESAKGVVEVRSEHAPSKWHIYDANRFLT